MASERICFANAITDHDYKENFCFDNPMSTGVNNMSNKYSAVKKLNNYTIRLLIRKVFYTGLIFNHLPL
jgi:hypothetical protein